MRPAKSISLHMRKRFVCVLARESGSCGPGALATVARHYGLNISPFRLRELLNTDLQGTDLESLRACAEQLGFDASCGKIKLQSLDDIPLPAIAHFDDGNLGHFVVIHSLDAKRVIIADPARGLYTTSREELLRRWSQQVVLLKPSPDFRPAKQRCPLFLDLLHIAATERKFLALSVGLAAVVALFAYGMSFFVKLVIDRVIPNSNLSFLRLLGIGILIIISGRSLLSFLRQHLLAHVGLRLGLSVGIAYVRHVLSLPIDFFDKRSGGDIFARVTDAMNVSTAIAGPLLSVLLDLLLLVACAAFMAWYNLLLMTITLCFLPVVIIMGFISVPVLRKKERLIREHVSDLTSRFVEIVNNIRTVKAYACEQMASERIIDSYGEMERSMFNRIMFSNKFGAASTFLTGGASVTLLCVGARLTIEGRLTVGQLMFFYSVLALFLSSIERLAPSIAAIQEALVGVERLKEINSLSCESNGSLLTFEKKSSCASIEFQNVSFWYRRTYPALREISVTISPGESVAILGETGSGKSTLGYLIAGLYAPKEGRILIQGIDISNVNKQTLRNHIAIVFQDAGLMNGSVAENIALGAANAPLDEIQKVAKQAMAHDFISSLPRGYKYEVGPSGTALSCGQRQRIAIARALLRNPAILVLDEATSNLDPETEGALMEALRLDAHCRTTIIITHRLTTAVRAHRILVLEKGRVIEIGNHQELMARRGKYHSLWSAFVPHSQNVTPNGANTCGALRFREIGL